MARDWTISRDEADLLIDLLETGDPNTIPLQYLTMADELRLLFGYVRLEALPAHLEKLEQPKSEIEAAKIVARRLSEYMNSPSYYF